MIIKKFQGKSEEEAIEKAKEEMGANAIVMNMKTMKHGGIASLFKKPYVEVTAALEEVSEAASVIRQVEQIRREAENPASDAEDRDNSLDSKDKNGQTEALEEKLDSLQSLLLQQLHQDESEEKKKKSGDEAMEKESESLELTRLIYNTLLENEVDEKYANQIIADIEKNIKRDTGVDQTLSNVYQRLVLKLSQPKCIEWKDKGRQIVFFIGPTGVGKTTTIAKIASRLCLEEKAKVALLTADTYRIAATEQLRTYANILTIPFQVVYSPEDLQEAVTGLPGYDVILVDTSGHSSRNQEQMTSTKKLIESVADQGEVSSYLVLSATTKYKDLLTIADAYEELKGYRIIFTKADETLCLGNILNLKLYTGADLSYMTNGQNVPDDIEKLNPQRVVKQLLGGN
jgi:flagellar biosynthesis protein FlhF